MAPSDDENPSSSTTSLLSSKTTSSNFATTAGKRAKSLFATMTRRRKGESSSSPPPGTTSGTPESTSSTSEPSLSTLTSTSKDALKPSTQQHPAPRDWDAAFGQLASEYGFASAPGMASRPVLPSKKFKERTAPDSSAQVTSTSRVAASEGKQAQAPDEASEESSK
ncbi:hypothetical protein K488DRAFT_67751 [Vararia minispora EC-137]|uniref:Uncharacterized protein n=1 Tax=Vararia minispora EC-137 TaxID=1314806 RepID=A0ACB8QWR4_9AGAM|nr:hypothetical protein K488DRAFT_67751 [Vararia minispora EC-137]